MRLIGTYRSVDNTDAIEMQVANMDETTILEALGEEGYTFDDDDDIYVGDTSVEITVEMNGDELYLEVKE